MITGRIGIDTTALSFEQATLFTASIGIVVKDGPGKTPNLFRDAGFGGTEPLRMLLGVPADWLTAERQCLAEALYAWVFDTSMVAARDIWTDAPNWRPANPRATRASLSDCTLDLEFIDSFGIKEAVWGRDVFRSTSLIGAVRGGRRVSSEAIIRAYIALGAFGFTDPSQFFIEAR